MYNKKEIFEIIKNLKKVFVFVEFSEGIYLPFKKIAVYFPTENNFKVCFYDNNGNVSSEVVCLNKELNNVVFGG